MENKQKQIVESIKETYSPVAIYMSGSRARNRSRIDSDWDLHLVVGDNVFPVSGKIYGESIDIKYIQKTYLGTAVIDTPYSPAVPFSVLFRDASYEKELNALESRTLDAYKKGPLV